MSDVFADIRLIALDNVANSRDGASIRRVIRWFSKNYSTPISVVEEMPFDYILMNYYEASYEEMSEEELKREIEDALQDGREEVNKDIEDLKEYEFIKQAEEMAAKEAATKQKPAQPPTEEDFEKISMSFVDSVDELEKVLQEMGGLWTEKEEDGIVGVK